MVVQQQQCCITNNNSCCCDNENSCLLFARITTLLREQLTVCCLLNTTCTTTRCWCNYNIRCWWCITTCCCMACTTNRWLVYNIQQIVDWCTTNTITLVLVYNTITTQLVVLVQLIAIRGIVDNISTIRGIVVYEQLHQL